MRRDGPEERWTYRQPTGRRSKRLVAAVGLLLFAALLLGSSATTATSTKWYLASISSPNPATIPAGQATNVTIRISNCGGSPSSCGSKVSTQYLGSANITFPSNFSLGTPFTPVALAGQTFTAAVNGQTIELRNPGPSTSNALAPGQYVDVTVPVTPTSNCGLQPALQTSAKQANDYSGSMASNGFKNAAASDPAITIAPGSSVAGFAWTQPNADQTAGVPFAPSAGIKVEARDACGNVVTSYSGSTAQFSGLGTSPNGSTPTSGYGFSWSGGVATSTTLTAFKAETTKLRVTDTSTSASAETTQFTVAPAAPTALSFTQQPSLTAKNQPITPPVKVEVEDLYGNLIAGVGASMTLLDLLANGGSFTGSSTTTATTDASGIATFGNLRVDTSGPGYKLRATSGTATGDSQAFTVADEISICPTDCTSSNSSSAATYGTITAGGTIDGQNVLAMTISNGVKPPDGFCGDLAGGDPFGIGAGMEADFVRTSGDPSQPDFTITARLDKSLVKPKPQPNGAATFDVCLGAKNVLNAPSPGTPACTNPFAPDFHQSFPTKSGTCAPYDVGTNLYWGLLPDLPNGIASCSDPAIVYPGVLRKNKNNAGDVIIDFCVPYPIDEKAGFG